MKKHLIAWAVVLLLLLPPHAAAAQENINVVINGQRFPLSSASIVDNGVTLVPMRIFFESIGAQVFWDEETGTVVGIKNDVEVRICVDSNLYTVNGREISTGCPVRVVNGVTYVPLRFIGEAFGYEVEWNAETREIVINCDSFNGNVDWLKLPPPKEEEEPEPEPVVVYSERGMASWYGDAFAGRRTTSGERFDPNLLTAAHRDLPFGTNAKVTFLKTGKSVVVRINDRGPHRRDRIIDLSRAAAEAIGLKPHGIGEVLIEVFE